MVSIKVIYSEISLMNVKVMKITLQEILILFVKITLNLLFSISILSTLKFNDNEGGNVRINSNWITAN